MKSHYFKKFFGADPTMKDDGTGTIEGTISYKKKYMKNKTF